MSWAALLFALSAFRATADVATMSEIADDVTRFMTLISSDEGGMVNRRLSGVDTHIIDGTPGEQIAFIVEREVWANGTVSGRRLGTALGRKFANEIDGIINNNDEGVKDGRKSRKIADDANSRRLASGRQLRTSPLWGRAKSMARKGKKKNIYSKEVQNKCCGHSEHCATSSSSQTKTRQVFEYFRPKNFGQQ